MTPQEIEAAFYAHGRSLRNGEIGKFLAAGVAPLDLVRPDLILGAAVHIGGDRFLFRDELREPAEFSAAFILPARDELGGIWDLAAWRPSDNALASWRGRAWALGTETLADLQHVYCDGAFPVFREPLEWLRAARDGLVIIDAQAARWNLAGHGGPFLARDLAHGRELRQALTIAPPRILIQSNLERAAA